MENVKFERRYKPWKLSKQNGKFDGKNDKNI